MACVQDDKRGLGKMPARQFDGPALVRPSMDKACGLMAKVVFQTRHIFPAQIIKYYL
jgi:hypothetical protein